MISNNDVYKILVATGDQNALAQNKKVSDLVSGQIGLFNYDTKDSLVVASDDIATINKFFIATLINDDTEDETIVTSAGNYIEPRLVTTYDIKKYSEDKTPTIEFRPKRVSCNTSNTIRFELRYMDTYSKLGVNAIYKTYICNEDPCEGNTEDEQVGDPNVVIRDIYIQLKNEGIYTLKISKSDDTDLTNDLDGIDTYISDNKAVNIAKDTSGAKLLKLDITLKNYPKGNPGDVQLNYVKFKGTDLKPYILEGFKGQKPKNVFNTKTDTSLKFGEGTGHFLRQKEYHASGWGANPGPYKLHSTIGATKNDFEYQIDRNKKYDLVILNYDQESQSGWRSYTSNLSTIIACERSDANASQNPIKKVTAILDKILAPYGFPVKTFT